MTWDAIIVGAGPAGCAAAYDLAAAGRRVLLLDKAAFPRHKACAGALTMKAVRALRYPIAPVVRKRVCQALLEHRSSAGNRVPDSHQAQVSVTRRTPFCVMTVRAELDAYCLDQTRARGAVFRQIGPITGLTQQPDRVLLHLSGQAEPLLARFLLGADGVHSTVRGFSQSGAGGARWFRNGFALEANVPYSATGRPFPLTFDFAPVANGYGWLFPRHDHVNVGLYTANAAASLPLDGRPGEPTLNRAALVHYIAARCGTGAHDRITGQFLGLGAAFYTPSATRILLVGDAAGFVDPLTGEGIYGAIASGQAAAAAVLAGLDNRADAASLYAHKLRRQQADLAVSERAAAFFYKQPDLGFRLMRLPLAGRAVLHAYSEGTSLAALAHVLSRARRLLAS